MVDSCDEKAAAAAALGAQLFVPPQEIPTVGKFSVIQDPQGAVFAVYQMAARASV